MTGRPHPAGLPKPGPEAAAHGERVAEAIRRRIGREGPIPFSEYMDLCLHAPGLGYYAGGSPKFGREGDFVTAPDISPLFSRCVARQIGEVLARLGGGEVLELGAGRGTFARECIEELGRLGRPPRRYRILETSAELRARQRGRLEALGVEWLDELPSEPFDGVVFANEVADALPVERFRITEDGLAVMHVDWDAGRFRWAARPAPPDLGERILALEVRLGRRLAAGYESEWCPSLAAWLTSVAAALRRGAVFIADYGYAEEEYYHPDRTQGTLLCHFRHHWHADPLILAGLQDITASVDFSRLARAADAAGLDLLGFTTQAWFLIGCGLADLVAESEPEDVARHAPLAHAVKQLTLPGEMGERVRVLGVGRGLDGAQGHEPLAGFGGRRLDDRL